MEIWVLFGVFTLLLLIGTPVAFCLGIASLATVLYMGLPPIVVFQQLNSGMNAFAMMAIPFFIYAGDLMMRGGIADRLIRLAAGLVGHLRGGLGQVNVVASTLFGGISGSAIADASAIGGIMIPQMEKRGYAKDYSRQRHGQCGDHRAADPAVPQHDHLFDRGRRHDLGRGSVHGRHRARLSAGGGPDDHGLCGGRAPRLSGRSVSRASGCSATSWSRPCRASC